MESIRFEAVELTDAPTTCDADGLLDNTETGQLQMRIRNDGFKSWQQPAVAVSSTTPGVYFPQGTSFTLPPLPPLSTRTLSIPVSLSGGAARAMAQFRLAISDPSADVPSITTVAFRTQADEVPLTAATDDVESRHVVWNTSHIGAWGTDAWNWRRVEASLGGHELWGPDPAKEAAQYLTSPPLIVSAVGTFGFTFRHYYAFEQRADFPPGLFNDGGVIELSTDNGETWTDIGASATPTYDGVIFDSSNPLLRGEVDDFGRPAYGPQSAGFPAPISASVDLGSVYNGQTVLVRFASGGNSSTSGLGWFIDNISFTGIDNTPFDTVVADRALCRQLRASAGGAQSTNVMSAFSIPLQATLSNYQGQTQSNQPVTFTAPTGGASGTFAGGLTMATATTNASGVATAPPFTANGITGSYTVTASTGLQTATYSLTNVKTLYSGPMGGWIGLKNSDDVGLRLDLLVEVLLNGQVVNSGQLNNVASGSSGFDNAILNVIPLNSATTSYIGNPSMSVRLSARRTCTGAGHNSGTVRLWYNGAAIDSGATRDAGSRIDLAVNEVPSRMYLRAGSVLLTSPGNTKTFQDVAVNSAQVCPNRQFSALGTWTGSLP